MLEFMNSGSVGQLVSVVVENIQGVGVRRVVLVFSQKGGEMWIGLYTLREGGVFMLMDGANCALGPPQWVIRGKSITCNLHQCGMMHEIKNILKMFNNVQSR